MKTTLGCRENCTCMYSAMNFHKVLIEVIHQGKDSSGLHILHYPALHNCFKAPFLLGICFPVEKPIKNFKCLTR